MAPTHTLQQSHDVEINFQNGEQTHKKSTKSETGFETGYLLYDEIERRFLYRIMHCVLRICRY